jgi:hypothetical protein
MIKSFFDLLNTFWTKEYNTIHSKEKAKHSFMVNRRSAINFPIHAAFLSMNNLNSFGIVEFWKRFLTSSSKSYPKWMYTKTAEKKKTKEKSLDDFDNETISKFCKLYNFDIKNVKEAFEIFPNELYLELNTFQKNLNI